ncbi:MAG: tetratricopeptide repeat protein [Pseudomonadota bacterium]
MALVLIGCTGAETRKARYISKGEALMAERSFAKARLEFRNALQIDPKDSHLQVLAAQAAEQVGEYREAATLYRAAITDEANIDARTGLAKLYVLSGATDDAIKLVDDGLSKAPRDAGLLTMRGATKMQRGDLAGAREDAEAALAIAPEMEDAAALLASLHVQQGDRGGGIAVLEQAAKRRPQSLDLPVALAQLYLASDQRPAAEAQLKKVIGLEPQQLKHRYRLAQFYMLGDEVDAAEATLREAVRVSPGDTEAKLALANLIATRRSFEAGEQSLIALTAEDSRNVQLRMGLGRFYETHGRIDKAEQVYRAIVADADAGSRALEARNRLAAIALSANRSDDARDLLEQILKASPRDNEALAMRAQLLLSSGDAARAIVDLRAVLRDQPNSQPLLRALAQAYRANGDAGLAEEALRTAARANPRDIQTRLALARLLIDSNRADEAQPVVDQLVADQPGDVPALEAAFRVQMARRDFGGARRSAAAIRKLQPDSFTGHYLAGLVEQADGKLDAARTALEKATELAPEKTEPLAALLRVDLAQQQPARALQRIDAAIARYPRSAVVYQLKADTLTALRRWDEAISVSTEASTLAPKAWSPYRSRGRAQWEAGRVDQAVAAYRAGIEATDGAPMLVTDLATLHERAGQFDAAIAEYEGWLKREPGAEIAANNLAMLLVTHRAENAAALARALEISKRFETSNTPALLDTYAWVRYARGEYAQAVPSLQRAVDLAPRIAVFRARLGLAQKAAGQRDAARKNLESALSGNARFAGLEQARAALADLNAGS